MGTRADFYIGRGEKAEWIGSIAWDGYQFNEEKDNPIATSKTEEEFREEVIKMLKSREDATFPDDGWPWPWDTSNTTDFAYAFDSEKCWYSIFGSKWFEVFQERNEDEDEEENESNGAVFPDMSSIKNLQTGKKSGLIVIGG